MLIFALFCQAMKIEKILKSPTFAKPWRIGKGKKKGGCAAAPFLMQDSRKIISIDWRLSRLNLRKRFLNALLMLLLPYATKHVGRSISY